MKTKLLKKFIRMSKYAVYSFVLQSMFCSFALSHNSEAQAAKLDEIYLRISFNQASLEEAFLAIEQNTEFIFAYVSGDLPDNRVTLSNKRRSLEQVLLSISEQSGLSFRRVKETIHVRKSTNNLNRLEEIIQAPQQSILINGKVNAKDSPEGLPGVNVIIKGTAEGTATDIEGKYSLRVPSSESILVFSSIGYTTEEVKVGNRTIIDIMLITDVRSLSEVVVIGYGAVKKEDLTGSVGSLNSETISQTTITDATGALQGRVAGVNIERNVGRPGSGFNVTIRGLSSITGGNAPLFVVDGIPTGSSLADLNPNDIEKIDVLKDASATAIYGSRGANGVVIVTTKKGQQGKFTIQYDANYGVRTPTNLPDMMNGEEYVKWKTYMNPNFFNEEEQDIINRGDYTDWIDLVLRNGIQFSNTVTASGGDANGTFALSIGQLREEGTALGQDYNRYNMRLNLNRKFAKKWEAGGNLYFSYSVQNEGSYEILRSAYRMPPVAKPYDEDGNLKFFAWRNDFVTNPLFEPTDDGEIREIRRYRAFGNLYLSVKPIESLTLRSQISPQIVYRRHGIYLGPQSKNGFGNTNAERSTTDNFGYVLDNQIEYQKKVGSHNFNLNVVQSLQYDQWEDSYQRARRFPFNSKWHNLGSVTPENILNSNSSYSQRSLASFLGRLQYSFNNRYLFTATGRYDGSSRLAVGNKWAFFPSAAFAWKITEEDFMQNVGQINNLKLRLSYGVSGNDHVDIYGTQSNLSQMYYDFDGAVSSSYFKNRLANTNITWERTSEINFGLDYGVFNYRISGTLDVYRRDAKDLIMQRQLPSTSGWGSVWDNIGWVRNTGIEIGLNTLNIKTGNFSWSTDIIFDRNKNEIVELFGKKEDVIGNSWFIGEPIQVNYDYEFDGIWQLDEADLAAQYGQRPGQVKVKDLDNNKVINAQDRKIIGQRTPKWSGSITNTLNYKNWDFSFYVYTRQGQQLNSTFVSTYMAFEGNYKNLAADYWTEENPSNKYPKPGDKGPYFNAMRYRDISFVRVGNVSLGYGIPMPLLSKLNLSKLRVYVTATNPLVFTSYEGYDPEWAAQNTWGESTSYATYLLGINLEF